MALDLLSAAQALIAIDSRSSVSTGRRRRVPEPLCRDAGLEVALQSEHRDGVEQSNLVAGRPGRDGAALLLATHLDTVPPGDPALWTVSGGKPFTLTERDGELYGLGCADVKLDFLCKLAALERLRDEELRRPVVLAGTYGEEVGRSGRSCSCADSIRFRLWPSSASRPRCRPCPSHKGYVRGPRRGNQPRAACDRTPRHCGAALHRRGRALVAARSWRLGLRPAPRRAGRPAKLRRHGRRRSLGRRGHEPGGSRSRSSSSERRPNLAYPPPTSHRSHQARRDVVSPARRRAGPAPQRHRRLPTDDSRPTTDDAFKPPYSTVNNGRLRLGLEACEYACDVRLLPGDAPQEALDDYLRQLHGIRVRGAELAVRTRFAAPPFAART